MIYRHTRKGFLVEALTEAEATQFEQNPQFERWQEPTAPPPKKTATKKTATKKEVTDGNADVGGR